MHRSCRFSLLIILLICLGRVARFGQAAVISPEYLDARSNSDLQKAAAGGDATAMTVLGWRSFNGAAGQPYDRNAARVWWLKAAAAGSIRAMTRLGCARYHGMIGNEVYPAPVNLDMLVQAAKDGDSLAMTSLGFCYNTNFGVPRSTIESMKWLRKAADAGSPAAMVQLFLIYAKGRGVHIDMKKSQYWHDKALDRAAKDERLEVEDMYEMSRLSISGWGGKRDIAGAEKWALRGAKEGDPVSLSAAGLAANEAGDLSDAIDRWKRAAQVDELTALGELGPRYLQGAGGIKQDKALGVQLLRRMVDQGDGAGARLIAAAIHRGELDETSAGGSQKEWEAKGAELYDWPSILQCALDAQRRGDMATADAIYERGADAGIINIMKIVGDFYLEGSTGFPQDYARATRWYIEAAKWGQTDAMNILGGLYLNGFSVRRDSPQALYWLTAAAHLGDVNATYNLGKVYAEGKGVVSDPIEARKWMEEAARGGDADAKAWLATHPLEKNEKEGIPR